MRNTKIRNWGTLVWILCSFSSQCVIAANDTDEMKHLPGALASAIARKEELKQILSMRGHNRRAVVESKNQELRTILQSDSDADNRRIAALLLGESQDPVKISNASGIARKDSAYEVRIAGVKLLEKLPGSQVDELARNIMENDPHAYVRLAAAEVLGKRGQIALASNAVWREADSRAPVMRRARAIQVLGQIPDTGNVERLQTLQNNVNEPPEVRFGALRAVSNIQLGQLSAMSDRLTFLKNKLEDSGTTQWAVARLVDIGTQDAAQILLNAARTKEKYGTPKNEAKYFTKSGLYALYQDHRKIQHMIDSGRAEPLP